MLISKKSLVEPKIPRRDFFFLAILLFLSVAAPLGLFLKNSPLRKLGLASLASPLLIVYSEPKGEKLMLYNYLLKIKLKSGTETQIILDKEKYLELSSVENPFNRHILIIPYMAASFMLTGPDKSLLMREKILSYGLCNHGKFANYLGLTEKVERATIQIFKNKTQLFNEFNLHCR